MWESAFTTKTYLTGAHGSRHRDEAFGDPYELPPDRAYAETCAAIASFHWNWRMLLATGGHRYADEMERVLYNAIAVGTATDGRHFFYSNPLQLRAGHDGSNEDAPSRRRSWFTCACCPPNFARLMASLQSYVATTDDRGLQIHLYGAETVHSEQAEVELRTGYPWDGRVTLTVRRTSAEPWTLALRIPGWCQRFTVAVDGVPVDPEVRDGYARLTREWAPGSSVVLDLAMPARMVAAHPRVDAVRGCVALARGPLVYCLEQADAPDGVGLEDLRLDPAAPVTAVAHADASPAPVTLAARGVASRPASPVLYRDHPPPHVDAVAVPLTAVPYFRWGNRAAGPMRVFIPVAGS
jgi:hypothetical protein